MTDGERTPERSAHGERTGERSAQTGRPPHRSAQIDRAFAAALDVPPSARDTFLAELRSTDPGLADAVARLLAAASRDDPRLDPDNWRARRTTIPRHAADSPMATHASDEPQPQRVGPYRVVRELGRGGMSVVYLAERVDGQFEQRVALKFLDVPHVRGVRRFEQERQILAGLSHPNIARLLDGGSDERGRPYIVMEHVEGRPLDVYCDATAADLARRLELVGIVAGAVEYAHRNLVVHQDLKPSNILVTDDGQVKLLDFGIAKLLAAPANPADAPAPPANPPDAPAPRTLFRALTPEYASPEQVRGERITTASDVYQLGALLYELLAGRRPIAFTNTTPAELERAICEGAVSPPSVAAARARRTLPGLDDPAKLRRALRGDIDTIVLKAMDSEPERRYASVGEMHDDLQRFRRGVPVRARTPTIRYRAAKFVRRHRTGVAAGAVIVLLLAGYVATVTTQSRRLREEAAKTAQVKQILASLFTMVNPGVSQGQEPTASDMLAAGARRIAELDDQPDVQAELMAVLGEVYGTMGRYGEAADLLEPALARQRRHLRPADPLLASTTYRLAQMRHAQGRLDEAEALLREAIELRRRSSGERSGEVGVVLDELGDLLHSRGELAEAESMLRDALGILASAGYSTATTKMRLANVQRDRGAYAGAETLYRTALADLEAQLGAVDPVASLARSELTLLLAETGRHEEADALASRNLEVYATLYPNGHAMVGTTLRNLGVLRLRQGRHDEARELLAQAIGIYRETLSAQSAMVPRARRYVAEALLGAGEPRAAAVEAANVITRLRQLGLGGHPAVPDALEVLALAELELGRTSAAVALFEEAVALRERLSVPADPRLLRTRARLAAARDGGSIAAFPTRK